MTTINNISDVNLGASEGTEIIVYNNVLTSLNVKFLNYCQLFSYYLYSVFQ